MISDKLDKINQQIVRKMEMWGGRSVAVVVKKGVYSLPVKKDTTLWPYHPQLPAPSLLFLPLSPMRILASLVPWHQQIVDVLSL